MKKMLALTLALGLLAGMTGCGESETKTDSETSAQESTTTESTETSDTSDTDETDIMVAQEKIDAAINGLGDWEADYTDMEVSGDESFTWGYVDMAYKITFPAKIRNTMAEYCRQNFPNVTILEADGQNDANVQLQLTENFITQGVDCIILNPADSDACVGVIDACMENGVRLIVVNSVVHHDEFGKSIGYVGSSNYEAGRLQGQWIIDHVDDTKTVNMCYQKGEEGYDHTTQRLEGVFDALDEAGFNYDLKSTLASDYFRDIALQNAEDWVTSYGDEIQCIPCCNDESAMGTLQGYQAAGITDVSILGIDANQDCLQEVKAGNIACTVFQNALGQAKWTAIAAYNACVNDTTETRSVDIPFELVDSSNVDEYLE